MKTDTRRIQPTNQKLNRDSNSPASASIMLVLFPIIDLRLKGLIAPITKSLRLASSVSKKTSSMRFEHLIICKRI